MAKKQTDNPDQMSFGFGDWLASPTSPPSPSKEPSQSPRYRLAERLHELLADGEPLTPRQLSAEATDVFGCTQAEGKSGPTRSPVQVATVESLADLPPLLLGPLTRTAAWGSSGCIRGEAWTVRTGG